MGWGFQQNIIKISLHRNAAPRNGRSVDYFCRVIHSFAILNSSSAPLRVSVRSASCSANLETPNEKCQWQPDNHRQAQQAKAVHSCAITLPALHLSIFSWCERSRSSCSTAWSFFATREDDWLASA